MRGATNLALILAVPGLAAVASASTAVPASAVPASVLSASAVPVAGGAHASARLLALEGQLPGPVANCPDGQGAAPPATTPWAQRALSFSSVWGQTEGAGVTVAVIDSGVDENPQFGDRVAEGPDLAASAAAIPAGADCVGHGTAVASIIAAAPQPGVAFSGVAPQARVLSIKITNSETIPSGVTASAIRAAVSLGANVINLSLADANTPALQSAVQFAQVHNVVVVAAAGNDNANGSKGPFYPAAYPGVLSVGAVGPDGALAQFSDTSTPVTVTAPGVNVTSAYPGSFPHAYSLEDNGTSFATAFVSGVAALVRAAHPGLSASQVVTRIAATADGRAGPGTGQGMVNPVQAVTAVLPEDKAAGIADRHVLVNRPAPPDIRARTNALAITGGAFGLAVAAIAAATVIPAARRRRWRTGSG
ncbi:MAG TPA: S8 family serine peptidase [Trebonia sp.]|nr:S8 family serine peptidase [Trebonia sp.]